VLTNDIAMFERLDPITGDVATRSQAMTVAQAIAAADAAQAALPAWSALGPSARRACLAKAATALEAKAEEFVEAMTREIGATEGWARFNVTLAASMIREAAALTTQISGEVIPSDEPGCLAMAIREPAGVVFEIVGD
jgi:benzaldehyde dehydrogenase (NAD)